MKERMREQKEKSKARKIQVKGDGKWNNEISSSFFVNRKKRNDWKKEWQKKRDLIRKNWNLSKKIS